VNVAVLSLRELSQPQRPEIQADLAASDFDPEIERRRSTLKTLISRLAIESCGPSVNQPSVATAHLFISKLPNDRAFPRVAPDGEGGLMLVWGEMPVSLLVIIDDADILPVLHPGTEQSRHLPPMRFRSDQIPSELLNQIPPR
jgi:hypothetical protein